MKLGSFYEKTETTIPNSCGNLIMPDFIATFSKFDQGSILSQHLLTNNYTIWKFDLDLCDDLVTSMSNDHNQFAFLLSSKGNITIQAPMGSPQLFGNCSVVFNLHDSQVKVEKGKSTFWITNPIGDHYNKLENSLGSLLCKVAFLKPADQDMLGNLFLNSAITDQDSFIRDARMHFLISRVLEELTPRPMYEEDFKGMRLVALDLKKYLDENYTKRIRLNDLNYGVNARKAFYREYEVSPRRYLQNLRINEARKLLRNTKLSIQDIAWEVGYETASGFTRIFSAISKQSPLEFRHVIVES